MKSTSRASFFGGRTSKATDKVGTFPTFTGVVTGLTTMKVPKPSGTQRDWDLTDGEEEEGNTDSEEDSGSATISFAGEHIVLHTDKFPKWRSIVSTSN